MDALAFRRLLADPSNRGSLADRSRRARCARLLNYFPEIAAMTVIDLGGTAEFWEHAGIRPADLTLVNVIDTQIPWARTITGDACDPPAGVFDRSYDLVICNSVLDQIGGVSRREQLADVISRLARRYWVQTANRWFPIDAYFLFPWFTVLPIEARLALLRRWPLTHMHTRDPIEALHRVTSVDLQSARDMRRLFPDAEIVRERYCGATKSLIAVRAY